MQLGTWRQKRGHALTELYAECRSLGLSIDPSDLIGIENIVGLLEKGNEYQGFRYFNLSGQVVADLSYTREAVQHLMRAVEPYFAAPSTVPGPIAKLRLTLGKPVLQQGIPSPQLARSLLVKILGGLAVLASAACALWAATQSSKTSHRIALAKQQGRKVMEPQ